MSVHAGGALPPQRRSGGSYPGALLLWALLVAGLVPSAVPAAAAPTSPDAWHWLAECIQAEGSRTYLGYRHTVLFEDGAKVKGYVQKVVRRPGNCERIVVLEPERRRGQITVSNGRDRWEYTPGAKRVVYQRLPALATLRAEGLSTLASLRKTLEARTAGEEAVAGRACRLIALSDKRGRPVRRVWIDKQQAVELKVQGFDSAGEIAYSWFYASISFTPEIGPGAFTFQAPAGATVQRFTPPPRMTLEDAQRRAGFAAYLPERVPSGYVLAHDRVSVSRYGGKPVLWLPFTNGVDTFSLFESRASLRSSPNRASNALIWSRDGCFFMLVGALTAAQQRDIQRSMKAR